MKNIPDEEIKRIVKEVERRYNKHLDYLGRSESNPRKFKIRCKDHGSDGAVFLHKLKEGRIGCLSCGYNEASNKNTLSIDAIQQRLNNKVIDIYKNRYFIKDDFQRNKTRYYKIYCSEHDSFYEQKHSHIGRIGCKFCISNHIHTKKLTNKNEIQDILIKQFGYIDQKQKTIPQYTFLGRKEYKNMPHVVIWCNHHKSEHHLSISNLKKGITPCKACYSENRSNHHEKKSYEEFAKQGKSVHYNRYEYPIQASQPTYKNAHTKFKVICKECSTVFLTSYNNHIYKERGCPWCGIKSKGEFKIKNILKNHKIRFSQQYHFENMNSKFPLYFDFYIKHLNLVIEFDGIQHFMPRDIFGGYEQFKILQQNDRIKDNYCINHNINLIRISYDTKNIEEILLDKINLIKKGEAIYQQIGAAYQKQAQLTELNNCSISL